MTSPTLLWFRRDLRLDDHPALLAAAADNADVLGVFVADDVPLQASGAPRRAFLAGAWPRCRSRWAAGCWWSTAGRTR